MWPFTKKKPAKKKIFIGIHAQDQARTIMALWAEQRSKNSVQTHYNLWSYINTHYPETVHGRWTIEYSNPRDIRLVYNGPNTEPSNLISLHTIAEQAKQAGVTKYPGDNLYDFHERVLAATGK